MMAAKVHFYNLRDIQRLVFTDMGLESEEEQRTKGEFMFVGKGQHLMEGSPSDNIFEVRKYDKCFRDRFEEHAGE